MARKLKRFTPDIEQAAKEEKEASWASQLPELVQTVTRAKLNLMQSALCFGIPVMEAEYAFTDRKNMRTACITADMSMYLNVEFWQKLDIHERSFVLAHEVMHVILGHFQRLGNRDPRLWNQACDYVINRLLVRGGLRPPKGLKICLDSRFDEMSEDQIYKALWQEREQERQQQQQQQQQNDSGQSGQPNPGQGSPSPSQGGGQKQDSPQNQSQGGSNDQEGSQAGDDSSQGGGGEGEDQDQSPSQNGGSSSRSKKDANGDPASSVAGSGSEGEGDEEEQGHSHGGTGEEEEEEYDYGFGEDGGDCDFGATEEIEQKAERGQLKNRRGADKRLKSQAELAAIMQAALRAHKDKYGTVPGDLERMIQELGESFQPWHKRVLQRFTTKLVSGYTYDPPNLISPSLEGVIPTPAGVAPTFPGPTMKKRTTAFVFDVSGSMADEELSEMYGETKSLIRNIPGPKRLLAFDHNLTMDEPIENVKDLKNTTRKVQGGGGTDMVTFFAMFDPRLEKELSAEQMAVLKQMKEKRKRDRRYRYPQDWDKPVSLIIFSDLQGRMPSVPPKVENVIWVYTGDGPTPKPPFPSHVVYRSAPFRQVVGAGTRAHRLAGQLDDDSEAREPAFEEPNDPQPGIRM